MSNIHNSNLSPVSPVLPQVLVSKILTMAISLEAGNRNLKASIDQLHQTRLINRKSAEIFRSHLKLIVNEKSLLSRTFYFIKEMMEVPSLKRAKEILKNFPDHLPMALSEKEPLQILVKKWTDQFFTGLKKSISKKHSKKLLSILLAAVEKYNKTDTALNLTFTACFSSYDSDNRRVVVEVVDAHDAPIRKKIVELKVEKNSYDEKERDIFRLEQDFLKKDELVERLKELEERNTKR
ncbi:hypothetical protein ACTFIZ_008601 [Dictyostelium cf. discoideum]